MSLPIREQRALDVIEYDLRRHAPKLAAMLAVFTRLTREDEVPRTELIQRPRRWQAAWRRSRRTVEISLAVPLALGLVALIVFLAVSTGAVSGCKPGSGAPYVVAGNSVLACQSTQKPAASGHPAG